MTISIRPATLQDIPRMAIIGAIGFQNSPNSIHMFPERLRVKEGMGDRIEWFTSRTEASLPKAGQHYIVAVERDEGSSSEGEETKEEIVGYAQWISPTEGQAQPGAQRPAMPPYIDVEAMERMGAEIEELIRRTEPGLKGKKKEDMWTLNSIAVDENHRRKGIGEKLTQWGMDAATREQKDIWLIAAPQGMRLYKRMGFELLGEGSRAGQTEYVMMLERQA